MTMCKECSTHHGVECTDLTLERARPDQLRRLLRDIFRNLSGPSGRTKGEG
jgi:hypothetical protein